MKIRILPEAERDLDIGADFYESQAPGAPEVAPNRWTDFGLQ